MVKIDEGLIRRRAEHNEGVLADLREVALHQFEIEKIEVLGDACKKLEIVFLQNNLISKIENLHKLKSLQYLNLALNNISRIEGLERCESLQKLDLTVNFVDDLLSVENLRDNIMLSELYLTGNPCTKYEGYRPFVIGTLPQLQRLDGVDIERSEHLAARQSLQQIRESIARQQAAVIADNSSSEYGREQRTLAYRDLAAQRKEAKTGTSQPEEDKPRPFSQATDIPLVFNDAGRAMQRNDAKVGFSWSETQSEITLDIAISKFVDTSLIDVDVQPRVVRVLVKGTPLVLVPPREVMADSAKAERSKNTGHLLLKLPVAGAVVTAGAGDTGTTTAAPPAIPGVAPRKNKTRTGKGHRSGIADYRNIVKPGQGRMQGTDDEDPDESEVPPLL